MPDQIRDLPTAGGVEPPHAIDPSGSIGLRFTEPPGVLMQLLRPTRGTTEMAEWLAGPGLRLLFERFPHTRDLRVIMDMRQMTGRSASARAVLMQSAVRCVGRVGHVVVVPSEQLGPAYRQVVEAGVALVRLSGLRIDIEDDLPRALSHHGVSIAPPEAKRSSRN